MRILMAHQDAQVRGRLRRAARALRSNSVEVAASADETSRRVRTWRPDLVVMSATVAERYRGPSGGGLGDREHGRPAAQSSTSASQALDLRWDRHDATRELAVLLAAMDELPPTPQSPSREAAPAESTDASPSGQLSAQEREILAAVAAGASTTELAAQHGVAEDVIDAHVTDAVAKLHRLGAAP